MNWKSISVRAMEAVILRSKFTALILLTAFLSVCNVSGGGPPQFSVPGQEADLAALNELYSKYSLDRLGQDEDRQKSKDFGFNGHLVKVDHAALMKLLAKIAVATSRI